MSRADESIYPMLACSQNNSTGEVTHYQYCASLTIREHFAASVADSVTAALEAGSESIESISRELGIEAREYRSEIHWDLLVAKRIVRRADALLAELAKVKS